MKKIFLFSLVALVSMMAAAQDLTPLQIDTTVRVGHLPNGLTYYIRHNEQPKQRCDFHIAQKVGAVLEEDNQNGLAHFLEHMAFNGTQNYPGKGIINYFESNGVSFGGNINAYTSIDETVYRLSDVPTRPELIDSALLVMHDWACGLLLLPEEIDAERGVILEEWRTRNNANGRMNKAIKAKLYPNSPYGKRDVIGDTAVILHFEYDALRDYYTKWYGPDNQAIVVVGDINVDSIEAKIQALWANVPERSNRGERPIYTVDFFTEPTVAIATDPEAQQTTIRIDYLREPLPKMLKGTRVEYALDVIHSLIGSMLQKRFDELALKPDASVMGMRSYYFEPFKLKESFTAVAAPKEGRETDALRDLLFQLEKMHRYGFTQSELDIAKTEMLNDYEKSYNERDTRRNQALAREYVSNFTREALVPGISWEYEFIQKYLPTLDLKEVNIIAKEYILPNPAVQIMGPEKEGVNIPSEEDVLKMISAMPDLEIAAPENKVIDTELVKHAPKAGKIKKVTYNEELGTTEMLLKNDVRVIIKPTDFKQDEILFSARSAGGQSLLPTEDLASAFLTSDIIEFMGLGDFSRTDLDKALAGRTVNLGGSIDTYSEGLNGSSSIKDFETLLQLVYLTFTAARRDEEAYQSLMNILESQLVNKDKNHKAIFRDSVSVMVSDHSPRTVLLTTDILKQVSLDKVMQIQHERFANPADFIYIFVGNINPDDAATRKAICTWLGGLKTSKKHENFRDHGTRVPKGEVKNYFTRKMQVNTATNRIQYTSYDIPYTLENDITMSIIGNILSTRYLESIREREGGSYGVSCGGSMNRIPVARATLTMQFDTDPEKQERLMEIIHEEVMTIINEGPRADDLQKVKEKKLKSFKELLERNNYWKNCLMTYYRFNDNEIGEYEAIVNGITAEKVQDLLRKLVESGNVLEVVMMPE